VPVLEVRAPLNRAALALAMAQGYQVQMRINVLARRLVAHVAPARRAAEVMYMLAWDVSTPPEWVQHCESKGAIVMRKKNFAVRILLACRRRRWMRGRLDGEPPMIPPTGGFVDLKPYQLYFGSAWRNEREGKNDG
jgi:hypothetical protein